MTLSFHRFFAHGEYPMYENGYEDGIEAVYSFIERAGIRLKVNEVLVECLEKGNTASLQDLIEELIVVGPESLRVVREIISEVDLMLNRMQEKATAIDKEMMAGASYHPASIPEKSQNHIALMNEIHAYLNDWLWGLIYLSTRHEWAQAYSISSKTKWLL
jgi:hypothetical protein